MSRRRILVIDDSKVIQTVVSRALQPVPDVQVIATADNGKLGLESIKKHRPDLVLLDMEMPVMNGLEVLQELRKTNKDLPVVMFSALTKQGAAETFEALELGANDYIPKPANQGSLEKTLRRIRSDLLPKINEFCAPSSPGSSTNRTNPPSKRPSRKSAIRQARAVVLGISTGGPVQLMHLVPLLPADLSIPIMIVQHMPPVFTARLAERLNDLSAIQVAEAADGDTPRPGQVLIAPGGSHMVLEKRGGQVRVKLNQEPQENSCRPAVDPLFRSAAAIYGNKLLAVVMTGMGKDGLRGVESVHKLGGQVVTQDEASSAVWGMPGAIHKAGLSDVEVSLREMHRLLQTAAQKT